MDACRKVQRRSRTILNVKVHGSTNWVEHQPSCTWLEKMWRSVGAMMRVGGSCRVGRIRRGSWSKACDARKRNRTCSFLHRRSAFYGPRPGTERLTETSSRGEGFLADVVTAWEEAAAPAESLGVRTVMLRIGIVLGENGGPLEKMILPFKMFAGGPIGDGSHVISWIHSDDVVQLILFCLDNPEARGPINAVAPNPVTNAELSKAIGRAMHRPSWLRVPTTAIKVAMGEASEFLTTGQRVLPHRATELGYKFRWPNLDPALASILGK